MLFLSKKAFPILLIVIGGAVCLFRLGGKVKNMIFMAGAEKTTGYVKNMERWTQHYNNHSRNRTKVTKHILEIEYCVNDKVYTKTFYSGTFGISEGKKVAVYYKKKNPGKAVTELETKIELNYIYPLMVGLGILFLVADKDKKKKDEWRKPTIIHE